MEGATRRNGTPMTHTHTTSPATEEHNRFRSRSLAVTAAALATTGSAGAASANVISDLTNVYDTTTNPTISLDGTAFGEISLISELTMGGMNLDLSLEAPAVMWGDSSTVQLTYFSSGEVMATEWLDPLIPTTDTVDGTLDFTSEAFIIDDNVLNSSMTPDTEAYVGFIFNPTGTLPLYGWLRVQFNLDGDDFTVDQWAFDDTGAPIGVGFVPEPNTALLLGLGLALLSKAGRRLKRSAVSPEQG
jgi:hypothetical protein